MKKPHDNTLRWARLRLMGLAIALLLKIEGALAICPCGDGICNPTCIPPETPNSCPADCGPPSADTIKVQNAAFDAGLLIDGAESSNGAVVNDRGRVSTVTGDISIDVGRLTSAAAPNRNEAIGFGRNRAPRRSAMPWTIGGNDHFLLALGSELRLPVTVWIVQGPFDRQRDHAFIAALGHLVWRADGHYHLRLQDQ